MRIATLASVLLSTAGLVLNLSAVACTPMKPPATPGPEQPANGEAKPPVTFVINTYVPIPGSPDGLHEVARSVSATETAIQEDGQVAMREDPETKVVSREPLHFIWATPWRHGVTLGPGVVSVAISIIYLGRAGDIVSCHLEQNGQELPGSEDTATVAAGPVSGSGLAQVTCIY